MSVRLRGGRLVSLVCLHADLLGFYLHTRLQDPLAELSSSLQWWQDVRGELADEPLQHAALRLRLLLLAMGGLGAMQQDLHDAPFSHWH